MTGASGCQQAMSVYGADGQGRQAVARRWAIVAWRPCSLSPRASGAWRCGRAESPGIGPGPSSAGYLRGTEVTAHCALCGWSIAMTRPGVTQQSDAL